MYTLGIETSCDETSVAVVKDGSKILSNEVSSSLRFHKKYGGVVPEIASRKQLETITAVSDIALKKAGLALKDIRLISVTDEPGLCGSLLVGVSFAKALSLASGIPLLGVNHVYSHIYANFLQPRENRQKQKESGACGNLTGSAAMPFVALVISGGHTSLFYVKDFAKIELLGETRDDACGEAFDKAAKILGLSYPGGPLIEKLATKGRSRIKFSCSDTKNPLDFSFSGIKTAVLYYIRGIIRNGGCIPSHAVRDIAASFQETVINTLIKKSLLACKLKKNKRLLIGGGVAANHKLRESFYQEAKKEGLACYFPIKELCMDNGAMVAGLGYQLFKAGADKPVL